MIRRRRKVREEASEASTISLQRPSESLDPGDGGLLQRRQPRGGELALAEAIHGKLLATIGDAGYPLPDRGVKEDLAADKPYGHFFSLRGPTPSVLVESMFLTNPAEAALLRDEPVIEAIARGIAEGIIDYLQPNPHDVVMSDAQ